MKNTLSSCRKAEFIDKLSKIDIGRYRLSQVSPGVDSIVEYVLTEKPDFDSGEILINKIASEAIEFSEKMMEIIDNI
ncbi:MAG: hypothetical protein GX028_12645 [Clostridiaceae bacterium]|nr:hypothetical protein [Clostridiaceae bacterium]